MPAKLSVLIPVYQGLPFLNSTIQSIRAQQDCGLEIEILVGIDGAQSEIREFLQREQIAYIEHSERKGKWRTLQSILSAAEGCEWVALVDVGTLWPSTLLRDLCDNFQNPEIVGIAPAYQAKNASFLRRLNWKVESYLKQLENLSGGPVSVHGSTCFYRAAELHGAFEYAKNREFLNDDVVLPLLVRALSNKHLMYRADIAVLDSDVEVSRESSITRTARIARGNREWILDLLPQIAHQNLLIACIALRRVFRSVLIGIATTFLSPRNFLSRSRSWA